MGMCRLLIFTIIGLVLIHNVQSWTGNVCYRTICSWRWERRCAYYTWQGCCAYKWARVSYYYNEYFCCNGWTTSSWQNCNQAICRPNCANGGRCVQPGVCSCADGYTGYRCGGAATCSYTSPCFPGDCQGSSGSGICVCADGFSGSTCLTFQNEILKPIINRCNATFTFHMYDKNMDVYSYFGDATTLNEPYVMWSNQRDFNVLDMVMEANFDTEYNSSQSLPDYVHIMRLGIVSANVETRHYKLGSGGSEILSNTETYNCNGPTKDQPISNRVLVCKMNGTNNIRVDSGDRFVLTFSATSGGYRRLKNRNTQEVYDPQYYSGKTASNDIEFKFDYNSPVHCSEKNPPCTDKSPLHLPEDITRNSLQPRWDGWTDSLSGVMMYSFEVWKMVFSEDFMNLREPLITQTSNPEPEFIQQVNITNPLTFPTYTPSEPGVYSCILEVSDTANNTRYARRIVIFDKTSTVTTRDQFPLYSLSASPESNYSWQTDLDYNRNTRVNLTWKDHFINQVHANGHFLADISYYEPRLSDGGRRENYKKIDSRFDDNEGKRTLNGTTNVNGIIKFEFAHQIPPVTDITTLSWTEVENVHEDISLILPDAKDGYSRKFFVRATDIMGNQKTDSTTLHFDASEPSINEPNVQYNIEGGRYDFSSRFTIVAKDTHSGVPTVTLEIATKTGTTKYQHTYNNLQIDRTRCQALADCYCNDIGICYSSSMTFDVNNCWMGVGIDDLNTEMYTLNISAYNGAMLSNTKTVAIADVKNLTGIQKYFGVVNLKIMSVSDTSFRLEWEQPKSCYEILGIKLMVTDGNDRTKEHAIFKGATSYLVGELTPSTQYTFQMFTKYGTEDNFVMSEAVASSLATHAKLESGGIKPGGIAGITIGFIILIVVFVVILIFLQRRGKLTQAKQKAAAGISHIRKTIKREPAGYNNRAYSSQHDDDIYFYGGMQFEPKSTIDRKLIAFESEISRGRFAVIFKTLYYGNNKDPETVVAKTLKDHENEEDIMKMRAKINFYSSKVGHHKNILDFIGSVEDEARGPFMVLEYCETGSLKDYLRANKSKVNEDMQERLFRISYGICMGMDYLASQKIVHKRLAARNVLLNFLHEPKITGFGPDPEQNEDKGDTSERIPVKWVAPECMTTTEHATERSDVWSYGVVLWEIFSMGETPYPDVKSSNLPSWLKQNNRLAKPEYCDDSFYKMMKKCWHYESSKRPNFKKLKDELSSLFHEGPDDDYYYRSSRIYDNKVW